ncbi:uncharacterized protein HKW66_Vig0223410 [Vigna angularis]|uniref:CCHC-type domain-containing protein n=2 Tax=Phaseolus angularis TaxID=3914 RepID=A0A8T0K2B7_PHAAN|nr:uncharacterized protein HKW66_Vig0223410 [Vigna angularis]BAT82536.1 hypothetical protein VIGAN_03256700 [Vigna angularis var. angularis]
MTRASIDLFSQKTKAKRRRSTCERETQKEALALATTVRRRRRGVLPPRHHLLQTINTHFPLLGTLKFGDLKLLIFQLCLIFHIIKGLVFFFLGNLGLEKLWEFSSKVAGAMALEEGKVKIEKFDGSDFGFWKMQIEDYLYQKKLYLPLRGEKPNDMEQSDWELLDRQALGVIRLTLAKNVALNIMNKKTTADLMQALSNMYEKPSLANKVYLIRRLVNLKMDEGNSVTHHISKFNTIIAQLASMQITFDDEIKALLLLSSLPESWGATVTIGSNFASNSKLKFDNILDLILSEDVHRRSLMESSRSNSGSALSVENRGRNSQKGCNQGRGRSKSRRRSQTKVRNDITCWNCQKNGHFKNQCRASRKNNN